VDLEDGAVTVDKFLGKEGCKTTWRRYWYRVQIGALMTCLGFNMHKEDLEPPVPNWRGTASTLINHTLTHTERETHTK